MTEKTDSKKKKLNVPIKTMTLDEFVDKAKLVLDEGLEEFCSSAVLKPIYENSDYREYSTILNTPRINTACRKQQRMASMFPMTGINLGSRDLLMKKFNYDVTKVTGQRNLILRTDAPKIVDATVWGHGPGDRGEKVLIPFWADCQFMAVKTEFTREDGSKDTGVEVAYLEGSAPISREQLHKLLADRAFTADMLEENFRYQPIVLRGKIGTFSKLPKWKSTGKRIQAKDRNGNPIMLPNGTVKMKDERVRDDEGFPCIQGRIDNPEEEIYTFGVTVGVMDRSIDTKNVVKFKFLNKKMARHFVELNSHQRMFRDAFARGIGTANDAFDHLTNSYRGTEVLAVGVLTRWDDQGETVWIDVEGTMLLALNMSESQIAPATESPLLTPSPPHANLEGQPVAPVAPTAPSAPPVPETVVENAAGTPTTVAAVPTTPAPSAEPVPVTEAVPAPASSMATEKNQSLAARLDAAIKETMEMYGKDKMTFEEFEDFGLCPEEFIGTGSKIKKERKKLVEKRIVKVREGLGGSEVGSYGDKDSPTSVSTLTPEEAERTEVSQICAACGKPMLPTPHGHWEVCEKNPKNIEKVEAEKAKAE